MSSREIGGIVGGIIGVVVLITATAITFYILGRREKNEARANAISLDMVESASEKTADTWEPGTTAPLHARELNNNDGNLEVGGRIPYPNDFEIA